MDGYEASVYTLLIVAAIVGIFKVWQWANKAETDDDADNRFGAACLATIFIVVVVIVMPFIGPHHPWGNEDRHHDDLYERDMHSTYDYGVQHELIRARIEALQDAACPATDGIPGDYLAIPGETVGEGCHYWNAAKQKAVLDSEIAADQQKIVDAQAQTQAGIARLNDDIAKLQAQKAAL